MKIRVAWPGVIGLLLVGDINVWLLTVIVADMAPADNALVGRTDWASNVSMLVAGSNNRKPISAYHQILAQPIFFKTRKPSYDDLVDHCCEAWNKLVDQPWRIMSIGLREWTNGF